MNKILVVDYGMGNLRSVAQALMHVAPEAEVRISGEPDDIRNADRIVLPGQGAMPDCMRSLRESGLLEAVMEAARNKPLFGVCVGEQMLFDSSAEGDAACLGLMPGKVVRFDLQDQIQQDGSRFKVPQMGWNQVYAHAQDGALHPMWAGVPHGSWFYFVHSYYTVPSEARHTAGMTDYGGRFTCAVARANIFATQFHPEKSADQGLALYRNFLAWKP